MTEWIEKRDEMAIREIENMMKEKGRGEGDLR